MDPSIYYWNQPPHVHTFLNHEVFSYDKCCNGIYCRNVPSHCSVTLVWSVTLMWRKFFIIILKTEKRFPYLNTVCSYVTLVWRFLTRPYWFPSPFRWSLALTRAFEFPHQDCCEYELCHLIIASQFGPRNPYVFHLMSSNGLLCSGWRSRNAVASQRQGNYWVTGYASVDTYI